MRLSMRSLVVAMSTLLPVSALALTLGKVEVNSAINQPLRAKVPLSNIDVPVSDLRAGIASASVYDRVGASRQNLPSIRFLLKDLGSNTAELWVVSKENVNEPFLDLIIHINEGGDISTHQLPILLKTNQQEAAALEGPQFSSPAKTPEQVTQPTPQSTPPSAPAPAVDPLSTGEQTTPTDTAQSEPEPTDQAVEPETKTTPEPKAEPKAQAAAPAPQAKAEPKPAPKASDERQDYKVVKNDTLWDIAVRYSSNRQVSLQEAMLSIQNLNQGAFINNNPNLIRAGAQIVLPKQSEAKSLAASEKQRQNALQAKASKPATPKPAAKPKPAVKPEVELEIVSGIASGKANGNPESKAADSKASSGSSTEASVSKGLLSKVTQSRASLIETRKKYNSLVDKLNPLTKKLELQNAQLAKLQEQLKALQNKDS